eukprot:m.259411 g.259411  ORF g.259411 m.259411 type:complete len:154 (+) comp40419_c0_seq12:33-494(+)
MILLFQSSGVEHMAWAMVLPDFYKKTLSILCSLIRSCNDSLLLFVKDINSLFTRILIWSKQGRLPGRKFPRSEVRKQTYSVLEDWLAAIGSGLDSKMADSLVEHMLEDVKPSQLNDESTSENLATASQPKSKFRLLVYVSDFNFILEEKTKKS